MSSRRYKPDLPPVTLGEVRALGISLSFRCSICNSIKDIDPRDLPQSDAATMHDLVEVAHCTRCNRTRGGISVNPDLKPWVKHLRETGQDDRVPYIVRGTM
ncbi:hypothetical protein PZ895_08140 [Mesorhizobium sp. YIM 152430]|uniref:hypothetical protein n=1 Tax=Mesorhizobium sp. YIM 152430 TaxID=3031761 RepID=UPI0023D9E16E|nr:hypothetical protein [Mesorhizobium sp. YIM 152430]MDF1599746.1 hypothetical protein [Mesorhizobium sp. YIM 152430]